MSICEIFLPRSPVKTAPYKNNCRYHRRQGQSFEHTRLVPEGCCPHLYRAAYPYCLSLMYDARYPLEPSGEPARSVEIRCPSGDNYVAVDISVRYVFPWFIRKLKVIAIRLLHVFNIAGEYPDRDILLKVKKVHGTCPQGLTEGRLFVFNRKDREELCPASFYAMYPALIRQPRDPAAVNSGDVQCPDSEGPHYSVEGRIVCEDFFDIKTEVTEKSGKCSLEKLPHKFCPLAFYSVFPYYLTLIHGGRFEWVKKGNRVRVQCPRVDGVVMDVELSKKRSSRDGIVRVGIAGVKGRCPRGHAPGDTFDLDAQAQGVCFAAMAVAVPFASGIREG